MTVPSFLGLILAGGRGERMGGVDKPLIELAGRTLLSRVVERMAPQCTAGLCLSANGDPSRFRAIFDGAIIPDTVPGGVGPLAGILAGLEHCAAHHPTVTHMLSVPGDTPFLPTDLVERLTAGLGPTAAAHAASGGRDHYAVALWPVSRHAELRRALVERGERRVSAFLACHAAAVRVWRNRPVDPFLNINTPDDLLIINPIFDR